MKLFHVSLGLQDKQKLFVPRVPESCAKGQGEDDTIPRICFSSSIEKCIQAIETFPQLGELVTIYTFEVDEQDPHLESPASLVKASKVPDALENQEYWYTKEVSLTGEHRVTAMLRREFALAWSRISVQDVQKLVQSMIEENDLSFSLDASIANSEQLYNAFAFWLDKNELYNLSDIFYDKIAELPWAQLRKVTEVQTIPYKGEKFGIVIYSDNPLIAFSDSLNEAISLLRANSVCNGSDLVYDYEKQIFCRDFNGVLHWYNCNDLKEIIEPKLITI